MNRRLPQTFADHVVAAANPALIMLLIGSLVFFLVEVFYRGQYGGRLTFIFAMFVLATVLISRIAMAEGTSYAAMFAVPMALATGVAMMRFVQIGGALAPIGWLINWGLLALIWWCANKLTWDCTFIDETQDASGEGLLQTVGLDRPDESNAANVSSHAASPSTGEEESGLVAWLKRQFDRKRPHTQGVWVVYFSLAALPLFGMGGWFIPSDDLASRRYTFILLCTYVASGMGLLMTTSFLGLRRYLRQRQVQMSPEITKAWIGVGCALIAGLMLAAWLLPRRSAEFSITQIPFHVGSPGDLTKSSTAPGDDGPPEEDGTRPGKQPGENGESDPQGEESSSKDGDEKGDGNSKSKDGQKNGDGEKSDGEKSDGEKGDGEKGESDEKSGAKKSDRKQGQSGSKKQGSQSKQSDPDAGRTPPPRPSRITPGRAAAGLMILLKCLFYLAMFAVAAFLAWRWRREIAAAWRQFVTELRLFWDKLFGRKTQESETSSDVPEPSVIPPRPFADFSDPFASGQAAHWSAEELVRYSFEAFEAWARQHDCPRHQEQTPLEFAQHVGTRETSMSQEARSLAQLYNRAAYAPGALPQDSAEQMRRFWLRLRAETSV